LECPENTVKTRMFHARKRLRVFWPELTGQAAGLTAGAAGDAQEVDA
jgi:DNA-directed RNA polymerase specialized sigma24 family protein